MSLVLDAGALLAVERSDRGIAAVIEVARQEGRVVIVPAGVVGQVWHRGVPERPWERLREQAERVGNGELGV
ncbi:MAG: hypothetical protein ACYDAQ_17865 [Mycobacteriales bacterium]